MWEGAVTTSELSIEVQTIVGPVSEQFGFVQDEVDDSPDEGGRRQRIVEVYESAREGELNCMIAPIDVPNEIGLRARKWQFLTRFSKRPDIPLAELAELARAEHKSYANPLEWLRDRIVKYYDAAHKGILEMYGTE